MAESRWAFIHPFQLRLQRGIEVYLWNLAAALARQGIRVDILTWDGALEVPEYAKVAGVNLRRVPAVRYFQAQFAVLFYVVWLLRGDYQHVLVHFAGYGEGLALRLARWLRAVPFSVVFHFPPSLVPHRYREFARWGFQREAAHLIAVSRATANEVEAWAGRACAVIGHGVDAQRFRPDAALRAQTRQALGIGTEAPVLISVAALEERKGMQWVIRALPELIQKRPDLLYWIIGDGPYGQTLEDQVSALNLQSHVKFFGFQRDVAPYLAASDIALLLSKGEASPVSLLEFAAAGLPVITSCHPPFPELIEPDWGQMVDEIDENQLVHAIIRLLSDSQLRKSFGTAGRARMIKNYTWQSVAQKYIDLIGSIK